MSKSINQINMEETPETWKVKESKQLVDCKIFRVREDSSESSEGKESNFYVIENPNWANVLALTDDNKVIIIEQFRHGTGEITIEIPGGMVDDEEDLFEAAKRELVEETGYTPQEIVSLGKCHPNPAIQDNILYHFLALGCKKTNETAFDSTESVVTKLIDLEEFEKLILDEKITHSSVLTAFLKYQLFQQKE